ncbi:MAG TPA: DNA-binding protein [Candidatus Nanoarchaeia archaeon]|nr:DNA-binding protein [Candidatus Nanoarchaeia archaeon]
MDELERIRTERLKELQRQHQEEFEEAKQFQAQVEQLEAVVKRVLTKEALQRYSNLKTAHPEKAVQLLAVIGQLIQQGRVGVIDDNALKELLRRLAPEKRETKIRRI